MRTTAFSLSDLEIEAVSSWRRVFTEFLKSVEAFLAAFLAEIERSLVILV